MKLVEADVVREDLWDLLKLNCRTPDLLDGDLRAMLGSTRIGADRVAALAEELGTDRRGPVSPAFSIMPKRAFAPSSAICPTAPIAARTAPTTIASALPTSSPGWRSRSKATA